MGFVYGSSPFFGLELQPTAAALAILVVTGLIASSTQTPSRSG